MLNQTKLTMKHKMKHLLSLALLAGTLTIVSCEKDKEVSKTDLLTKSSWKVEDATITSSDPFLTALFEAFKNLIVNSQIKFNKSDSGNTYTVTDSSGSSSGTWEFSSNETKLIFDKGTSDETTYDILKLTSSELEVKYYDEDFEESVTMKLGK